MNRNRRTTGLLMAWLAASWCAAGPTDSEQKVSEYLAALGSDTLPVYQKQSRDALVGMGSKIFPVLLVHYKASDSQKQAAILEVLGEMKQLEHCSFLMRAAASGPVLVQCKAMEALGKIGCPEAVPFLKEKLTAEHTSIRCFAIWALGAMGSRAAVPQLRILVRDIKELYPLLAGLDALGKIGDLQAVPDLLPYLKHREIRVRYVAAIALGNLQDKSSAGILFDALDVEPDYEVQEMMAEALGKTGGQEVLARFVTMFKSRTSLPRRHLAAKGLSTIGLPAVDYLRECLRDQDWEIQLAAIKLLGEMKAQAAVPDLIRILRGTNKSLQLAAMVALGQCDDSRALEPLNEIRTSGDALLEGVATETMAKIIGSGEVKK